MEACVICVLYNTSPLPGMTAFHCLLCGSRCVFPLKVFKKKKKMAMTSAVYSIAMDTQTQSTIMSAKLTETRLLPAAPVKATD